MNIIKKIYKRKTTIILIDQQQKLGNISYFNNNNKIIIVSNLNVEKKHQRKGIGSYLLKLVEKHNNNYKIFKLCAWQSYENSYLLNFYKKNGYNHDSYIWDTYDDGDIVYDLIPMIKNINN